MLPLHLMVDIITESKYGAFMLNVDHSKHMWISEGTLELCDRKLS